MTSPKELLDLKISLLQTKHDMELKLLKDQFYITYESLKPINFIKNTLNDVTSSPDVKGDLIKNAIGIGSGYLSKKILVAGSNNPLLQFVGSLLQMAVSNVVTKHSDSIIETGEMMLMHIFKPSVEKKKEFDFNDHYPVLPGVNGK